MRNIQFVASVFLAEVHKTKAKVYDFGESGRNIIVFLASAIIHLGKTCISRQ